jgi:hypothetical protein
MGMIQVLNTSKSISDVKEQDNIYGGSDAHQNCNKTHFNSYAKKLNDDFEENREFRRASYAFNKQKIENLMDDLK